MTSSPSVSSSAPSRHPYIWSLTLRDLLLIALVAALCMLAKQLLRVPVNVPGHSGVLWVALFVICRGIVDKRGPASCWASSPACSPSSRGSGIRANEWTKWLAAGIVLEVLTIVLPGDLRGFGKAAVVGAALHPGQARGAHARRPDPACTGGAAPARPGSAATTSVRFGVLGGVLGRTRVARTAQGPVPRRAGAWSGLT